MKLFAKFVGVWSSCSCILPGVTADSELMWSVILPHSSHLPYTSVTQRSSTRSLEEKSQQPGLRLVMIPMEDQV